MAAIAGDSGTEPSTWVSSEGWRVYAACRGVDTSLFFGFDDGETEEEHEAREQKAKAVCHGCAVIADCLEFALTTRQKFGIWGGLTERERTSELRRRTRARRAS